MIFFPLPAKSAILFPEIIPPPWIIIGKENGLFVLLCGENFQTQRINIIRRVILRVGNSERGQASDLAIRQKDAERSKVGEKKKVA